MITIKRDFANVVKNAAKGCPIILLTGPRQSGKTTLSKQVFTNYDYVSLENIATRNSALEDPENFLLQFQKGVILDEIQKAPELFPYLQGIVDEDDTPGKWILSGSQNFSLISDASKTLLGRTTLCCLPPLTYGEILRFSRPPQLLEEVLSHGSYPRVFKSKLNPAKYYEDLITTIIEKDISEITDTPDTSDFLFFLKLCAQKAGQLINLGSIAKDCKISPKTAKNLLHLLEAHYIVFLLPSMHVHPKKELLKAQKIYFYDSGLLCSLLDIDNVEQLKSYPQYGSVFENWAVSEAKKERMNRGKKQNLYFFRDSAPHREVDIALKVSHNKAFLIEIKSSTNITSIPSLSQVQKTFKELGFEVSSAVIHGGESYKEDKDCSLMSWRHLHKFPWEEIEDYSPYTL